MSAFIASGPPSRILESVIDGKLVLTLLETSTIELSRVLSQKLKFDAKRVGEVQTLLQDAATFFQPTPRAAPEALTGDPDDDLILMCAIEAGVDVLVTGDRRHLLPVGEHGGVRILTPQALLAELRSS